MAMNDRSHNLLGEFVSAATIKRGRNQHEATPTALPAAFTALARDIFGVDDPIELTEFDRQNKLLSFLTHALNLVQGSSL